MRVAALSGLLLLTGCNEMISDWLYTFRAEVGYYENGEQRWYVGPERKYAECIREAKNRFDEMNAQTPQSAFSWACRKMNGQKFKERVH